MSFSGHALSADGLDLCLRAQKQLPDPWQSRLADVMSTSNTALVFAGPVTLFNTLSVHQGFDKATVEFENDIVAALSKYAELRRVAALAAI